MTAIATAVAGVVVAHVVDYLLVFPAGRARASHLAATGHGYWPAAVVLASMAGAVAVVSAVVRAIGGGSERVTSSVARVAATQLALFTVIEVGERAVAGVSPAGLARSPEFWVGLLVQVAVAAIAVLFLRGVGRAACAISALLRRPPARRRTASAGGRRPVHAPRLAVIASTARPRGPPCLLVT
jgi:hypothetical protein